MRRALELLRLATEALPPPPPAHHCLTAEDGKLSLALFISPELVQPFLLEEADLDRDPAEVLAEIRGLLAGIGTTAS